MDYVGAQLAVPFFISIPCFPHILKWKDTRQRKHQIIEIPPSVLEILKIKIPIAGGFYFRLLQTDVLLTLLKRLNKQKIPLVLFFHPWECFEIAEHKQITNFFSNFITNYNKNSTLKKLECIISQFSFNTYQDSLSNLFLR